jgi:hypothetical protein
MIAQGNALGCWHKRGPWLRSVLSVLNVCLADEPYEPSALRASIPKKFLQRVPRFIFLLGSKRVFLWFILAPNHLKPFAIICHVLLVDWFSTPIAALMSDAWIVTAAIETDFEIGPAFLAGFQPARRSGQFIFRAALPTMSRRGHKFFYSGCPRRNRRHTCRNFNA